VNALLVRVGVDLSASGGLWNGPVDSRSYEFVYVPIPETKPVRAGTEKPYRSLVPALSKFGVSLPPQLTLQHMHLDPDFDYLTYGDQGERAKQLLAKVGTKGDIIVFYAGLKDARVKQLTYAIIGLFFVDEIVLAARMPSAALKSNAHSRRILPDDAQDIVVRASPKASGRLQRCIPLASGVTARTVSDVTYWRHGGPVRQRRLFATTRLPEIRKPESFLHWLHSQAPVLLQANN
jgi:Nucleotide modification associated domain 3